ncbi:hypothetical protein M2373_003695 [Chryseobacterium sp. JUb7]|nr:hypothetical protein [Chryseobacterium sp. JUb7]
MRSQSYFSALRPHLYNDIVDQEYYLMPNLLFTDAVISSPALE